VPRSTDVEQVIEDRLRQIDERLRVLAELRAERDRLQRALGALRSERAVVASSAAGAQSRGRRAKRGTNLKAILAYVQARPGATAGQVAEATGIKRTVVYSAVSRLTGSGRLGREELPDGQVGYRILADG
jgi:sugar-specific transcriptional regulator TrmB